MTAYADLAGRRKQPFSPTDVEPPPQHVESERTNESWHNHLKSKVSCAHPNVYKLIRELQIEQAKVEQELRALRQGQQTRRPPRRAYRRTNQRLERIKESFEKGKKTLMELLEACSYAVTF